MTKTKAPRQSKTPRQRAQEALDVEERRVARLTEKADGLKQDLAEVALELGQATARRDFLAGHPDLGDPAQLTIDEELDQGES